MSKHRKREEQELPFVALMDTMTNVVGVLIIVLVMVGISIASAVRKVLSDLPPVTPEEHQKMVEVIKELPPPPADPKKIEEDKKIAEESLDKVGMLPFRNRQIANLSGGQQQRVFLARALAQQSDLYLMDEPFAGVDATTERAIVTLLQELQSQGKTILVVHHDLTTAKEYFDHLLLLNMRLVSFGKTQDVFTVEQLQKTYGGRLTILSDVAAKAAKGEEMA